MHPCLMKSLPFIIQKCTHATTGNNSVRDRDRRDIATRLRLLFSS